MNISGATLRFECVLHIFLHKKTTLASAFNPLVHFYFKLGAGNTKSSGSNETLNTHIELYLGDAHFGLSFCALSDLALNFDVQPFMFCQKNIIYYVLHVLLNQVEFKCSSCLMREKIPTSSIPYPKISLVLNNPQKSEMQICENIKLTC
jgi:hypothetical protein